MTHVICGSGTPLEPQKPPVLFPRHFHPKARSQLSWRESEFSPIPQRIEKTNEATIPPRKLPVFEENAAGFHLLAKREQAPCSSRQTVFQDRPDSTQSLPRESGLCTERNTPRGLSEHDTHLLMWNELKLPEGSSCLNNAITFRACKGSR